MRYIKKFEEKNLDFGTLVAPSKIPGKSRGDVLIDKLEKGDDLRILTDKDSKTVKIDKVVIDGELVEPGDAVHNITTNGHYDDDKSKDLFSTPYGSNKYRYDKVLQTDDNELFKINDIVKTEEFGSSGPGRNTAKLELLQAIFLGIRMKLNEDITYESAMSYIHKHEKNILKTLNIHTAVEPIKQYIDNLAVTYDDVSVDRNWKATFVNLPNSLYRKGVFDDDINYSIYHISCKDPKSPTYILSKKYNELKRNASFFNAELNDGEGGMERAKTNIAKYCPADIYVVSKKMLSTINKKISTADSFERLTSIIDYHFDNNDMIPISLKKISRRAEFSIITNRAKDKKTPIFELKNINITKDPLRGIGSKIMTEASWSNVNPNSDTEKVTRSLTIDSSDTTKRNNVDGEIQGGSSRHGKISFLPFKRILNSTDYHTFDLNSYSVLDGKTEKVLIKDIFTIHDKILNLKTVVNGIKVLESPTKYNSSINETKGQLISKLQSLQIVYALGVLFNDKRCNINLIITDIMSYALSIKSELFSKTPKYLRVI